MKWVISRAGDKETEYLQPDGSWSTDRDGAQKFPNGEAAKHHARSDLDREVLNTIPGNVIVDG